MAFTHAHPNHFEAGFVARFYKKTRRTILGTVGVARLQPDVLIVPYPYVTTRFGWQTAMQFAPKSVVVVHTPARDNDPEGIWQMMEREKMLHWEIPVYAPDLCETVFL
ncbi:MAG: hypothetical protein E7445_04185 [Ruminococcaceae bacterium]|nr:hypothetical protein [Oscillospiraceae bacterium]